MCVRVLLIDGNIFLYDILKLISIEILYFYFFKLEKE